VSLLSEIFKKVLTLTLRNSLYWFYKVVEMMEYTSNKLSKMSGVSARTLRYYDEIGLLKPARIELSGYRIYGQSELDTLQQILFYRELGFPLDEIKNIIYAPDYDRRSLMHQTQNLKA